MDFLFFSMAAIHSSLIFERRSTSFSNPSAFTIVRASTSRADLDDKLTCLSAKFRKTLSTMT